ncbi:pyruvate, phosphate dikinase [Streptomyces sp. PU-14G]|uniref:pyruvate, phosphate dikinase n=1 Tax=Streptomyces sp. PU-14G TaxID=2800808 RepID=UPI0034DFE8A9
MTAGSARAAREPVALPLDGGTGLGRGLLGGKAAGIARMLALGAPVPPAFVLTTVACRRFRAAAGHLPEDVWQRVRGLVGTLERATGRTFGRGPQPLLVSVRSGAPDSMPGMMDTVLNVGLTPEASAALARADPRHAADTRRRFTAQFTATVGVPPPGDPWRQLRLAIEAVFASSASPRAVSYRAARSLAADAGTAVTVQTMVFGNRDARSGTGVLFTRDPLTGACAPYGEWLPSGQGEDVVSGRSDVRSLDELGEAMPQVRRRLLTWARALERDAKDVQDIEFTVEAGTLWLLQTRAAKRSPRAAAAHAVALADEGVISRREALSRLAPAQLDALLRPGIDPQAAASASVLARGKPASPGVGAGVTVVDPDAVGDPGPGADGRVLARPTTEPDDVPAMALARAVVTETGGSTSHAAVVCRELAVPCVVGCGPGTVAALRGRTVTVDGAAGLVYAGALPLRRPTGDEPALAALAEWAADAPDLPSATRLLRLRAGRSQPPVA